MDKTLIITRLRYFYTANKRMPTYGEMCKLLGYQSKGAVRYVVKKLIEDEVLAKDENGTLIPNKLLSIPMLGVIKAGYPMAADVQEDNYLNLHSLFENYSSATFALTISGDSMIEAGINEGDIVIVDEKRQPQNRDIVAACIDNEWTVKYLQKEGSKVQLIPANKNYPVLEPETSLTIGGVVVSVIRQYH